MIPREIRDIVDVTPVGDAIEHELSDECPCGPSVEAVFRPSGSNGWLRSHHSLDGRERFERTERGGTMSAPREHVEAVADVISDWWGSGDESIIAEHILTSTDPAVHAAMLDALVRAGVLREELVASQCTHRPLGLHFCSGAVNRRHVTEWEPADD